ncbi:RNA polymerase II subunit B1 CTD phosphatase Rpap2-like [Mizuhopecten yessoensis]|uniref:RNA polymerase II subunit B1 CTD phosphatase RPAP2 homolog n=1 Tax=Mizuhopecten yessoensis TaxID=6573 RepID=A0A210QJF9_MIZYE|nr:RNA polymerase II subunit B1 CTD phosphatase Rpap2-like [Mizuhopecten yessoensis]OWF48908.1 RNA polymerase II subunit B1 CTD phosphatase rpap2 [Mizuhopecten yessoensis]
MSSFQKDRTKPKHSGGQQIIDEEAERRKKIEQDVRRRQECEKKAFKIVEKLLENPVTEDTLLQDALHICPNHYDDIIEERAIAKLCGYPICPNSLGHIPKQKYHISTRSNKVYDITTRKNFCSNQCFTASQYLRRQLLTAPLWSRKHVNDKPFKLLPQEATSGLEGDEVISIQSELRQEVQSLERLEKYEAKSKDKSANRGPNNPDMLNLQSLKIADSNTSSNQDRSVSVTQSHSKSTHQEDNLIDNAEKGETKSKNKGDSTVINPNQNSETKTESGHHGDTMNAEAKMKHLQTLLNKRKHLLGQLADIQPLKVEMSNTKLSHDSDDDDEESESGKGQPRVTKLTKDSENNIDPASANVVCDNVKPPDSGMCQDPELQGNVSRTRPAMIKPQVLPAEVSQSTTFIQQQRLKNPKTPVTPSKSVIMILCQTMKQWVTKETIDFLSPQESDTPQDRIDHIGFQSKYEQLCRRIGNSENDLDDLIGESKMEDSSIPQKTVPDYRILKEETEEFGNKVAHYLQGKTSAALVVKEKDVQEQSEVHLPTVDSHDQMLIRKKIVMEKINRVMHEILTPLKLSMQEVFSELRQLVSTFRLGSQNIIFRPAEWTLVSLILFKMLARRQHYIAEAFKEESAVRYFNILLRPIHESETAVDQHVSQVIFS